LSFAKLVKHSKTFYIQLVRVNGFPILITSLSSSGSQVQIEVFIPVINDFYCFCSKTGVNDN
jgi:hypothetical protein